MKKEYLAQIKTIGLRVKELGITKNMTQQNLAGYCNLDIRTIQRIEKGEHAFATETLFSFANALQIEPQKLLEDL